MGMPQSLLYIKRVRASLQKQGCVRVTKAVEIEERHVQLFVYYTAGVLQCTRLDEGSILTRVHQMDRSSNRAEVAALINTNLLVSFPEILLRSLLSLIFILQQGQEDVIHGDCAEGFILGRADLQARLEIMIEEAYLRTPVDAAFISSCESLLQTVITGEYAPQPSIAADCQQIIRQNTHISKPTTLNWTGRLVTMAALLIAIVCIGEFVIDREWIAGTTTPDGSTYVIRSYEIDTGFISASAINYIADEDAVQFSTQEWSELTDYLGYEPAMIDASALGLYPQGQYDVFTGTQSKTLIMGYNNAGTGAAFQYVNCVIVDYRKQEDVLFAFQQNAEGRTVTIAGQEAYLSAYTVEQPLENQNHTSITWMQGTQLFHLTGNLSEEQLIMTAEMIIGE